MSTGRGRLRAAAGRGAAGAAAAGVVLVTAACGPTVQAGGGQGASSSAQPGSPPVQQNPAASAQPGAAQPGGASPGSGAAVSAPEAPTLSRCTVGMLKAVIDPGPSAMDEYGEDLIFTNTSGQSCTLRGYPGIKLIGAPSSDPWPAGNVLKTVTLRPGGQANVAFSYHDQPAGDENPDPCEPMATGVLVTPPGSYRSIRIPGKFGSVCAHGEIDIGDPVEPGAGQHV